MLFHNQCFELRAPLFSNGFWSTHEWVFVLQLGEEKSSDETSLVWSTLLSQCDSLFCLSSFHLFRNPLFSSVRPTILMSNNMVPVSSIPMETDSGRYLCWMATKPQKFITFTAQLHLLNTLNNVNIRKLFSSILEENNLIQW